MGTGVPLPLFDFALSLEIELPIEAGGFCLYNKGVFYEAISSTGALIERGGILNTAGGDYSSVSSGAYNKTEGEFSFIGGGGGEADADGNIAHGDYSAILGGSRNVTGIPMDPSIGTQSTVSGGSGNVASGKHSSVSGGAVNTPSGDASSVSGGCRIIVTDTCGYAP